MSAELKQIRDIILPTHCLSLARGEDEKLYAACFDGGIYAVHGDSDKKDRHRLLTRHDNFASGVNWSASMGKLVTAGYDGRLKWVDPGTGKSDRDIRAHDFWSWQSAVSADGRKVASSTGQYRCGGYKYEPANETEPSVRVYDIESGEETHAFEHIPPVESVCFSNNGAFLAAGNLMGEVRVWELESGREAGRISTPNFTGWGIIKGHYYTGGVFSLAFAPGDDALYLAGMGSTRDPAAGNGKQLWERWSWRDGKSTKTGSANDGEIGQGLMETLAFHPGGEVFVMGGRLFKGDWNFAVFDTETGARLAHHNCSMRISKALWSVDGNRLYLAGGHGQGKNPDKLENPDFGRIKVFEWKV